MRLCELSQTKSGYQLTKYLQREVLIDPALDDEAKRKIRREALEGLLKEAKNRRRRTIFGVPGRSVFTRCRTLPPVQEHRVTQIVRYEIQQQIPFALDQIALDYQILSRTEAGGYDVMMAAIKVEVVEKHLAVLSETKLSVDTVDVCPLAAYNWVKHTGDFGTAGECVALLDLGASATEIVIERGNQFRFTRPLNIGANDITVALSKAFDITFAEAEKLKRERGFAPTGDPERDGKGGEAVGQVLSRLVAEVNRSFAFFRSLPGGGPVSRVLLTGGGACLRNIVPYLQRETGVDVRIAQPLKGLAIGPEAQQVSEHPEQACAVLGLALRGCEEVPIAINLIPPRILATARRKEQVLFWTLSFITLALIAASVIPARANKDKLVQSQIATVKKFVRAYDPEKEQDPSRRSVYQDELEAAQREVQARLGALRQLTKAYRERMFWIGGLKALNDLRPEGGKIWFSSIETALITKGGGVAAETPGGRFGVTRGRGAQPKARGVTVAGFPGLAPVAQAARQPGGRGRGASAAPPRIVAPASPNGYRILGYAKDPEALTEFIDRLRNHPAFEAGVHFDEANVEKVPITELDNARVSHGRAVAGERTDEGSLTRERTGERFSGFAVAAQAVPTRSRMPVRGTGAPRGESVIFFRADVQFRK